MLQNNVNSLKEFIKLMQQIPFVASRHLYRLTDHFLSMDEEKMIDFCEQLKIIKKKLILCRECNCWKEREKDCFWCGLSRDESSICVVETWIEAISIERSGIYKGKYHVLGGTISLIDGVTPENLSFNLLIQRLKNLELKEIIIATNQTPEGTITASYIERIVKKNNSDVKVSYLASGVPVGSSLEFVDRLTLSKAFSFRR